MEDRGMDDPVMDAFAADAYALLGGAGLEMVRAYLAQSLERYRAGTVPADEINTLAQLYAHLVRAQAREEGDTFMAPVEVLEVIRELRLCSPHVAREQLGELTATLAVARRRLRKLPADEQEDVRMILREGERAQEILASIARGDGPVIV